MEQGEDCEPPQQFYSPGNGSPFYCGPACKLIDACEQCKSTCAGASCDDFTGAQRASCQAAEQCFSQCFGIGGSSSQVDFELCYCGGVGHAACVAGGAIGICRPQIEAAAGTSDGNAIFNQVGTHTPLGVGLALERCVGQACGYPTGCALPSGSACGNGGLDVGETCQPPDGVTCSATCTKTTTVSPTQVIDICKAPAPNPSWTSDLSEGGARALWATAPDDAWIALSAEVRHFDGVSWTTARVFEPGEAYTSLWASGVSDAWVGSTRALTRWNGTSWKDLLPFGVDLVWGVAPGDVWATRAGRLFHWVGGAWREEPLPAGLDASKVRIWALAGVAPDDVWAFGSASVNPSLALALHWDGATWSQVGDSTGLAFTDRVFLSAWASSGGDIWMSGLNYPSATELWHWDGTTWTATSATTAGTFGALSGTAANDVWSIGADAGQTGATLRHFDGTAWFTVSIGDRPITLLAASRTDDVWAYGSTYSAETLYHLHHACTDVAPPPAFSRADAPATFRSMVALGKANLWGLDPDSSLDHWDGTAWSPVNPFSPADSSSVISNIAGWQPNEVWATGADVMRWDGSAWNNMSLPNPSGYSLKVWGGRANDVWVQQGNFWMFHWDGSAWLDTDFQGTNVTVQAFAYGSPTDAWVLGIGVKHWDGKIWTTVADPAFNRHIFLDAFELSPSNIWALVINLSVFDTRMLHYDGSQWSVAATTPGYGGYGAVWASSASDVWATLPQGGLWHYDGVAWSTVNLGADYLYSVTGDAAGEIWASGAYLNRAVVYYHAP